MIRKYLRELLEEPPPPPPPWYKKVWQDWKQLWLSLVAVFGFLSSGFAYIKLDTTAFIETTEITVVADATNLYAEIEVHSEVNESAYILVYLDGQQVANKVYPMGIKEGKHFFDIKIPFTSTGNHLDVDIEIVFNGIRTLFIPERLEGTYDVEKITGSSGSTSNSFYTYPSNQWT